MYCSGKAKPCGVSQRSRRVVLSKVTQGKRNAKQSGVTERHSGAKQWRSRTVMQSRVEARQCTAGVKRSSV